MKRLLSILSLAVIVALSAVSVRAQLVPRMVLIEEGTNDGCGPCAQLNPGVESFLKQHEGSIVHIAYHPNWPNSGDPMYLNDATDNQYRVATYYGISGVPDASFDGASPQEPLSQTYLESVFDGRIGFGSPIALTVSRQSDGTTVQVHVAIHPVQDVSKYKQLMLRVAAVEDYVDGSGSNGKGPNGESKYVHVMRAMMPGYAGTKINLSTQDTAFDFSYDLSSDYKHEMYEVAFIQDDATHEVLQTSTDAAVAFRLTPNPGEHWVQRTGASGSQVSFTLANTSSESATYSVSYQPNSPNVWPTRINGSDASGMQSIQIDAGQTKTITVNAMQGAGTYSSGYLRVTLDGSSEGLASIFPVKFVAPDVKIAFVDLGIDSTRSAPTMASLDKMNFKYVPLTTGEAAGLNGWSASEFPEIMVAGNKWIVVGSEKQWISDYIASGGHLLMEGGEIAYGLGDAGSGAGNKDLTYLKNTLHATYVKDSAGPHLVHGVTNDPVSNAFVGTSLDIYAGDVDKPNQPDQIKAANGGVPIFYYGTGTASCAGVRWDSAASGAKLVYLSFGLQNLAPADREALTGDIFTWFRAAVDAVEQPQHGTAQLLGANYPNPFTSLTQIPYSLTRDEAVRIAIVDARGNEVAVVTDNFQLTGEHVAKYDGKGLARGTYFCVIHTAEGSAMRAMTIE